MTREEREQLLKDTLLYFAPKDRYVTDEEGNMYYREDVTLKAMELSEQPLPPAEGAEEILNKLLGNPGDSINVNSYQIKPLMVDGKAEWWIVHHGVGSGEPLTQWLNEFATLHAQKIADKMVSERDDDVFDKMNCLVGYLERWWKNPQSYPPVELKSVINEAIEYLKSREK